MGVGKMGEKGSLKTVHLNHASFLGIRKANLANGRTGGKQERGKTFGRRGL